MKREITSYGVKGRISIIIPNFNYGHFISFALESTLSQPISDLEVIVVDDGSNDETLKVLEPYRDRINYVFQENAGLSSARNTGIAASTGEYIQFLDADDILGKNVLAYQKRFLDAHPAFDISVCRNRFFDRTRMDKILFSREKWPLFRGALDVHLCHFNIAPPHALFLRKKVVSHVGYFDSHLKACEDYDYWLRAACHGFIPVYNPEGAVFYRRHPRSMSANLDNQFRYDAILHHKLSELLDQNPEFPSGKRAFGLLAFAAGALTTARRLRAHQLGTALDLLDLARRRIKELRLVCCNEPPPQWNPLSQLYCLKIESELKQPCFRYTDVAQIILSEFHKTLLAINFRILT